MTKNEIYECLKYEGVYNSSVKKRLNKLIKKYHPDRSKDKDTIKIILEVKKELESNNVSYSVENGKNKDVKNNDYFSFSTKLLIKKLKKELNDLNEQIEKGYSDEYKLLKEYSDVDKVYKQLLLKTKIDKREIEKLKLVTIIDKFILFTIILILVFTIYNFNYIKLFLLIFIIIVELLYLYTRFYKISILKADLKEIEEIIISYKKQFKDIDESLKKLKIDIFSIKKLSKEKFADIKYYEKSLNNKNEEKEIEKDMEYNRERVKYK